MWEVTRWFCNAVGSLPEMPTTRPPSTSNVSLSANQLVSAQPSADTQLHRVRHNSMSQTFHNLSISKIIWKLSYSFTQMRTHFGSTFVKWDHVTWVRDQSIRSYLEIHNLCWQLPLHCSVNVYLISSRSEFYRHITELCLQLAASLWPGNRDENDALVAELWDGDALPLEVIML